MLHERILQNTLGTVLAGAMLSAAYVVRPGQLPRPIDPRSLSGVLAVQVFFYLRRYPGDHRLYKFMVSNTIYLIYNHNNLLLIMSH